MIAISLTFPAGRYHATPWGRHVNEADVEWPPSPWRLLRALIATWHRKLDPSRWPEATLDSLVAKLAAQPPVYALPQATRAHTRHYMPVPEGAREKPTLIFDAFVRLSERAKLVASWANVMLTDDERNLLEALVTALGYLGRAESWVEAELIDEWDGHVNCRPSEINVDVTTGDVTEPVSVIVPLAPESYTTRRAELLAGPEPKAMKAGPRKKFISTLPERLLDALRLDTSDLQAVGWSAPPSARFLTYQRPYDCFTPRPAASAPRLRTKARWVCLALRGKPLPRIEDAVKIGEIARRAALSEVDKSGIEIPAVLSGHGLPEGNRHGHAFFLPEDRDGDGCIDHILIVAEMGFPAKVVDVLSRIPKLWVPGGATWQVLFEASGDPNTTPTSYLARASTWVSVTPYLHPWHVKRGLGPVEQLKRECRHRGFPEPMRVEVLQDVDGGRGRRLRAVQFRRFRDKRSLVQPDHLGRLLRLHFEYPVAGPLSLGFSCHFGLGLFRPDVE